MATQWISLDWGNAQEIINVLLEVFLTLTPQGNQEW